MMKIIFVLALLANIIFFLWEFNSTPMGGLNNSNNIENNEPKQILLKSEIIDSLAKDKIVLEKKNLISHPTSVLSIAKQQNLKEPETIKVEQKQSVTVANKKTNIATVEKAAANNIPANEKKLTMETSKNSVKEKYFIQQIVKNCYQIGPFKDEVAIEQWRQLNSINIEALKSVKKETSVIDKYMVFYPAESSFSESKKNLQIFEKLGVIDYRIFKQGPQKGAISLGLFIQIEPANLLQENLAKYNIDVEVLPQYKTQTILYAEVSTYQSDFKETAIVTDRQTVEICEQVIDNKKL